MGQRLRMDDEQEAAMLVIDTCGEVSMDEAQAMLSTLEAYAAEWDARVAIQRRATCEEVNVVGCTNCGFGFETDYIP